VPNPLPENKKERSFPHLPARGARRAVRASRPIKKEETLEVQERIYPLLCGLGLLPERLCRSYGMPTVTT
jgi:hypothetical protein